MPQKSYIHKPHALHESGSKCLQLNLFETWKTCVVCSEFVQTCSLQIGLPCPAKMLDLSDTAFISVGAQTAA